MFLARPIASEIHSPLTDSQTGLFCEASIPAFNWRMESWDILLGVHEAMLKQSLRDGSDGLTAWKTRTILARRDRERRLRILDSQTMYQNIQSIAVGPKRGAAKGNALSEEAFRIRNLVRIVLRSRGGISRFFQVT